MSNIEILITEEKIKERVKELAGQLDRDYAGRDVVFISILKGSFIFAADLIRAMKLDVPLDFMMASSYGSGTKSCGQVKIKKDIDIDITGKDVLIVEDIVDSGLTLTKLKEILGSRGAASVKICALLSKPSRRVVPMEADYLGFEIDDLFVIGYGVDYDEKYRYLPYIGVLNENGIILK